MNRQTKKTISVLLLLAILCALPGMAAAEGEETGTPTASTSETIVVVPAAEGTATDSSQSAGQSGDSTAAGGESTAAAATPAITSARRNLLG